MEPDWRRPGGLCCAARKAAEYRSREASDQVRAGGPRTGGVPGIGERGGAAARSMAGPSTPAARSATVGGRLGAAPLAGVTQRSAQVSLACSPCVRLPLRISRISAGSSASLASSAGEPLPHQAATPSPRSAIAEACAGGRQNCASQPRRASTNRARGWRSRGKGGADPMKAPSVISHGACRQSFMSDVLRPKRSIEGESEQLRPHPGRARGPRWCQPQLHKSPPGESFRSPALRLRANPASRSPGRSSGPGSRPRGSARMPTVHPREVGRGWAGPRPAARPPGR